MFCPACGIENTENKETRFCRACHTNLVIIKSFLAREDSAAPRSHLLSRTGLVSIFISEGFAWTLTSLVAFVLIIFIATVVIPRRTETLSDAFIATGILIALILFCGVPLLFG